MLGSNSSAASGPKSKGCVERRTCQRILPFDFGRMRKIPGGLGGQVPPDVLTFNFHFYAITKITPHSNSR